MDSIVKITAKLQKMQPKRMLLHSLSVMMTAEDLARHHGVNHEQSLKKIRIAGLLHDCAKKECGRKSLEELRKKYGSLDDFFEDKPVMAHSFIGAIVARREFNISDTDILTAIERHNFGAPDMSFTDKIIYLADYIEPLREDADERQAICKMAYKSLDLALLEALKREKRKNHKKLHPLSTYALEYITKEIKNG